MSKSVKIYYGPYESFFTLSYKPQKLKGLKDQLLKLGYRVDLQPVEYRDFCVLEMFGHEVFRCNINNLQFNTPCELDPVCQRAINAVLSATTKFHRARSYYWLWNLIEDQIFKRNEFAPKDYWFKEITLKNYATCCDCIKCCDILVTKND